MDTVPDASGGETAPSVEEAEASGAGRARDRPAGVPGAAAWLADRDVWEQAATAPGGDKHGEATEWRGDGTLYRRASYRDGRLDGPFTVYHPNGQVARQGSYLAGELDGPLEAYGSDDSTTENLRSCCVPAGAWQMKSHYQAGQRLYGETFYDRQGRRLLADGSVHPDRPPSLPAEAEFDEYARRWMLGSRDERGFWVGTWRSWNEEGGLEEEAEFRDTRKLWSRLYQGEASLRQEVHFEGEGVRHGPYRRRLLAAEESPWADRRIREERGAFERGQAVGPWTYLDASGAVVRAVDLGRAYDDARRAGMAALGNQESPAPDWSALSRSLRAEGRVREAVCAAARAAARSGSSEQLLALLGEVTVPLTAAANERTLAALAEGEVTIAGVLDALVGGADPAAVLRTLASILGGASGAARDLVDVAILLAPERRMAYLTRALVRVELGDRDGARSDAEQVAPESAEAADFLRHYLRVLFPAFSFWPAQEVPVSPLADMPDEPGQPLSAVRRAIQVYATRLSLVRAALARQVGGTPPWLPPDLTALLPDGPLELRTTTAQIVDQTEEGPETTEVKIDESLAVDGSPVPALLRMARIHWAGLGWLCWSAGLDRVALPERLDPPASFGQAAGMVIARYFRAQDAVATGGLRSVTAGVPGFRWEGMDIDGMARHFAEMVHDEYLEMRAVFLFLASPENLSPFQSDLRQT
jgi:MORN repeat variant